MNPNQFAVLMGVLLLLWIAYVISVEIRSRKASEAALQRIQAHPEDIVMARITSHEPLRVTVQFRDEDPVDLVTVRGLQAVRLFDGIRARAKRAYFTVVIGGRERAV